MPETPGGPRSTLRPWLLTIVAVCLVPRLGLWFAYEPILYPDTGTYMKIASRLAGWDSSDYDGARTPGYPLLLWLGGGNYHAVWLLQSLLGIATAVLLFMLTLHQSRSRVVALIAAIGCGLSINLIFSEAVILTETLSTFLLVLAVFLYAWRSSAADPGAASYMILGAVLSLAALTRPLLLLTIPIGLLFLLRRQPRLSHQWPALLFGLPPAVLIGGWSFVVLQATGSFTPTTLLGYNLLQHSGAFFALVPDEDAQLRDIYLRHRIDLIATTGSAAGSTAVAKPEMMAATGLNDPQLSAELTRISLALFTAHPRLYLRNVHRSWRKFWELVPLWDLQRFHYPQLHPILLQALDVQKAALHCAKWSLGPALVLYLLCALTLWRRLATVPLFALALIGCTALVQALLAGDSARYAIPFQPLIIFVVVAAASDGLQLLRAVTANELTTLPAAGEDSLGPD